MQSLPSLFFQDPKVEKTVKPAVLSCFGDVALAIGPDFSRYFETVMRFLFQAAAAATVDNQDDIDQVEYVEQLRESCAEAFTGIVQGLRSDPTQLQMLSPHVTGTVTVFHVLVFIMSL